MVGVYGETLPLHLGPQQEPLVCTLCVCGAVKHLEGRHS